MTNAVIRYRLGAEELIELGGGRSGVNLDRRPFLAGRIKSVRPGLGNSKLGQKADILDMLGETAPYISERLATVLGALSTVVDSPLNTMAANAQVVTEKVTWVLKRIPAIKDLLAQIQVLGGVLAKNGLSLPGLLIRNLGNILAGVGQALKENLGPAALQLVIETAKNTIFEQAPSEIKGAVASVLDASGVTGEDPAPNVALGSGVVTPSPMGMYS